MTIRLAATCLLLSSCGFDYATITVRADEPIKASRLILNGENIEFERVSQNAVTAKWNGGEASGEFKITFSDGLTTSCLIGYLEGSSFYAEKFVIKDRKCEPDL